MSTSFSTPFLAALYTDSIVFKPATIGAVIKVPAGLNTNSSATFASSDILNLTGLSVLSCCFASSCISSNFLSVASLMPTAISELYICFLCSCNAFTELRSCRFLTTKSPS